MRMRSIRRFKDYHVYAQSRQPMQGNSLVDAVIDGGEMFSSIYLRILHRWNLEGMWSQTSKKFESEEVEARKWDDEVEDEEEE